MKPGAVGLYLFLGVLVLFGAQRLVIEMDPTTQALRATQNSIAMAEAPRRAATATLMIQVLQVSAAIGGFVVAVGGSYALVRWGMVRSRLIMPHKGTGLNPLIIDHGSIIDRNDRQAKRIAAAVGSSAKRPTAAGYRELVWGRPRPRLAPPVEQLRIEAPEPQLMLPERSMIYDAEISGPLNIPIGIGQHGPVALPLRDLGNVLLGGLPGGGKSELIAAMIAGLMRQDASGRRLQFAAIDTKMISFGQMPATLKAMRYPVAKTIEDAHTVMGDVLAETQRRFTAIDQAGASRLEQYNQKVDVPLPYLILFIDELADLTGDIDRKRSMAFTAMVMEVGRKGRAAGVCVVGATQRPSVDVVSSSYRAVNGTQVAFRVLNSIDSHTILGTSGAETLPANIPGRCLVRRSTMQLVQAYWADIEGGRFQRFMYGLPKGQLRQLPPPVAQPATGQPAEIDTSGNYATATEPTDEQQRRIRELWRDGWSMTRISEEYWPGNGWHDDDSMDIIRDVLGFEKGKVPRRRE